ncbi:hypothetical protein ACHHYP_10404 [Achlya hypogyna]|uniref:EF-hand domain-containing protein n=1 Tax=Achlya hypogyna TaxID=1202772 RepID=A0A1V9YLJ4_ACHHY|nr:hypothetical protein ACHHYP_10404 [Achlya hypogyna]
MPPTHMTPQLRRQLSDEARRLFFKAHEPPPDALPLPRALRDMRAHLLLERGDDALHVQLVGSGEDFLFRYHLEPIGADVLILVRHGASTKWITYATGDHEALHVFLAELATHDPTRLKRHVDAFLEVIGHLELHDLVVSSTHARRQQESPTAVYSASTPTMAYLFECDAATGVPIAIECAPVGGGPRTSIRVTYYNRLRAPVSLEPPPGVASDLDHMMAAALDAYASWSADGKREVQALLDEIDHDRDGLISRLDVVEQLCEAAYALDAARKTAAEMTRLLCDRGNPSEEFPYEAFLGFWLVMLADDSRGAHDEEDMRRALHQLFRGNSAVVRL